MKLKVVAGGRDGGWQWSAADEAAMPNMVAAVAMMAVRVGSGHKGGWRSG